MPALALFTFGAFLSHGDGPMAPREILRAWSLEPGVVVGLALTAGLYAWGVRALWTRAGRGRGIGFGRIAAFAGALLALVAALVSPLDAAGQALFCAHMLQHVLLVLVAAPLLALGDLIPASLWAFPETWRRGSGRLWRRSGALRLGARRLFHPLSALALHTLVLWLWHVPAAYDAAVANDLVHALEHASFLATSLLFWESVGLGRRRPRAALGLGALVVFGAALQSGLLGALLTLGGAPFYVSHLQTTRAWGLTPLADQQLAGAIMWVPSGFIYLTAFAWLFLRWLAGTDGALAERIGDHPQIGFLAGERRPLEK